MGTGGLFGFVKGGGRGQGSASGLPTGEWCPCRIRSLTAVFLSLQKDNLGCLMVKVVHPIVPHTETRTYELLIRQEGKPKISPVLRIETKLTTGSENGPQRHFGFGCSPSFAYCLKMPWMQQAARIGPCLPQSSEHRNCS